MPYQEPATSSRKKLTKTRQFVRPHVGSFLKKRRYAPGLSQEKRARALNTRITLTAVRIYPPLLDIDYLPCSEPKKKECFRFRSARLKRKPWNCSASWFSKVAMKPPGK